jgi:hypothetical protein
MNLHRFTHQLTGSLADEAGGALTARDRSALLRIAVFYLVGTAAVAAAAFFGFMLFLNTWVGLVAGIVFAYIYTMVYIVLFATVRRAGYLPDVQVSEQPGAVTLMGRSFQGTRAVRTVRQRARVGWVGVGSRMVALLLFLAVPALFAVLLVEHRDIEAHLVDQRQVLVDERLAVIDARAADQEQALRSRTLPLERERDALQARIDSMRAANATADVEWEERRLASFLALNGGRIADGHAALTELADATVRQRALVSEAYAASVFFSERLRFVFAERTALTLILFAGFLAMAMLPFIARYRMMVRPEHAMDDVLSERHREIIRLDYLRYRGHVEAMRGLYGEFPEEGDHFADPPFNTQPRQRPPLRLAKQSLGRYLDPADA